MKKKTHSTALTIAGFDGSGGAGIQADLKTFSALGCYGMTVLTALPVQNTKGVRSIYSISEKCVEEQLQAILEDIHVDALKMGMMHRSEIIEAVAGTLEKHSLRKIVLDPVMIAKSGDALLTPDAIETMKKRLFPLVTVITPNLPEASSLLQREVSTKLQMEQAAFDLLAMGPEAVVVKGGHLSEGSCDDCLCIRSPSPKIHWFSSPRIKTKNTHGTGCTFSAAITAYFSKGMDILEAVNQAKKYTSRCIEAGEQFEIGHGNGPLHHFASLWDPRRD
jgi:hydroxymethylpyrimidine/phosphomethylpyrimidine kinase